MHTTSPTEHDGAASSLLLEHSFLGGTVGRLGAGLSARLGNTELVQLGKRLPPRALLIMAKIIFL